MAFELKWPGRDSEWVRLSVAVRKMREAAEDKEAVEEAAKWLDGVEIKVRTLTRPQYLELLATSDGLSDAEGIAKIQRVEASDAAIMRAGLADIRGLAEGDAPIGGPVSSGTLDALEATGLHGLIAWVVIKHNTLDAKERKAFFT